MKRDQFFKQAADLVNDEREKVYGPIYANHRRIAKLWSQVLGFVVKPHEVALCMAMVKISRLHNTFDHEDSYKDAIAYLGIAAEIATTKEYYQ